MDFRTSAPIGPQPEFEALPPLAEMERGFSEYFEAQAGNVIRDSPVSSIYRTLELSSARGDLRTQSRRTVSPKRRPPRPRTQASRSISARPINMPAPSRKVTFSDIR